MNNEPAAADSVVNAVVTDTVRITPPESDEVRRLVLRVDEPAFRVTPGQNVAVVVPGEKAFGNARHVRRYSITDVAPVPGGESVELAMLVKRCFYIDEINGERYPGVASNFLCDARFGQPVALQGPYKNPFRVPADPGANLLMIGTGTGIAPFRTMIQQVYREGIEWRGEVRLFYGARNGMESLYTNEKQSDLAHYYDQETFAAFNAVARRSWSDERDALRESLTSNLDAAWALLERPDTHVYLAGLQKTADVTDRVLAERAGGAAAWAAIKQDLTDQGRWSELLYG